MLLRANCTMQTKENKRGLEILGEVLAMQAVLVPLLVRILLGRVQSGLTVGSC